MLNITDDYEEKWINYSKDESYLIRYITSEKYLEFTDKDKLVKLDELIEYIVKDWKGIQVKKEEKIIDLQCTLENKKTVFDKYPSRWSFVLKKALDYKTFFDIEENEKN